MGSDRKQYKLRLIPSSLLIVSFLTHDFQLMIYKINLALIIVGLFGIIYLVIGVLLLQGKRYAALAGSVVPTIGAALGVYRFLVISPNPFSVFNVCLDAVIVPFSIIVYRRWH